MQKTALCMLFLTAFSLGNIVPAYSADELFDTKAASAHTEKGIEHLKKKDLDAAIREFEESVSINPDAEAYYFLGYAYYLKGKTGDGESRKRSKENFEKAYELNPGFTPSRLMESGSAAPKEPPPQPQAQETTPQAQTSVQEEQPETENAETGVFRGTAQPEQKTPETQSPATAPEPEKEKEQQPPAEPPKEEQPPQQTEQQKSQ